MVLVTLPLLQNSDNRQISKLKKTFFFFFAVFPPDWQSVTEREKFADAVLICTPDSLHKVNIYNVCIFRICILCIISLKTSFVPQEPAVAFAKKGYHILLEKPMAVSILSFQKKVWMDEV